MSLLPQFGFFELMLVAVIALIVVGPKDLPKLMRSLGQLMAKARGIAGEFSAAFDQMAKEAELDELRQEVERLKKENPVQEIKSSVNDAIAPVRDELDHEKSMIEAGMGAPFVSAGHMPNEAEGESQDPALSADEVAQISGEAQEDDDLKADQVSQRGGAREV